MAPKDWELYQGYNNRESQISFSGISQKEHPSLLTGFSNNIHKNIVIVLISTLLSGIIGAIFFF